MVIFHTIKLFLLEWSAALTVSSVCLSILSMLSSALKKVYFIILIIKCKPPNDKEFVKRAAGRGPKSFLWSFDDEKV
jgi:ubiquitin-conjugating enzyme E2 W